MTQVNTCLKRVFTIFNIFFAIIGASIIGLAIVCQSNVSRELGSAGYAFIILYIIGGITMVIAILGAYGAHRESRVSLIIFLVCMVVGSLAMLKAGVPYAIIRPQIGSVMEDAFRKFLPLDQTLPEYKEIANELQEKLQCCGLFDYTDWRDSIPDSCLCSPEEQEEQVVCKTVSYKTYMRQSKTIYSKPCFPIILHFIKLLLDIVLGVVFSLLVLALFGMILSSIIIHQMRYPTRPTVMMTVPPIFTTAPPKYQELHNPPCY